LNCVLGFFPAREGRQDFEIIGLLSAKNDLYCIYKSSDLGS
jgi:hypothetical protein